MTFLSESLSKWFTCCLSPADLMDNLLDSVSFVSLYARVLIWTGPVLKHGVIICILARSSFPTIPGDIGSPEDTHFQPPILRILNCISYPNPCPSPVPLGSSNVESTGCPGSLAVISPKGTGWLDQNGSIKDLVLQMQAHLFLFSFHHGGLKSRRSNIWRTNNSHKIKTSSCWLFSSWQLASTSAHETKMRCVGAIFLRFWNLPHHILNDLLGKTWELGVCFCFYGPPSQN